MTLEQWASNYQGDLKSEKPDPAAITELTAVARREVTDAGSVISAEGRLTHSYTACLSIAGAALAACGYRIRKDSRSHHYRKIESLEYTMGLCPEKVSEIQNYREDRHHSMYDFASIVSGTKADCALVTAESLLMAFEVWLQNAHPGLVQGSDQI
jgi:hypothetical protein